MPYFSFSQIQIGPVTIYVLGLFMAIGFLVSFLLILKKASKDDKVIITDSFSWLLLGVIIGSRLGYVVQNSELFSNPVDILKIWEGGMTFHGGLIGLLLFGIVFAKLRKLTFSDFLRIADQISLFAPLGVAIGRIGCTLINDHQGTESVWGIVWPDGIIRHPVAPYLIIANLIIFFILRQLNKKSNYSGYLFTSFLFLYSISRLLLDFTRSTIADPRCWGLSTVQWLSILIILGIIIIRKTLKSRNF